MKEDRVGFKKDQRADGQGYKGKKDGAAAHDVAEKGGRGRG
jgi:hypothetical protein